MVTSNDLKHYSLSKTINTTLKNFDPSESIDFDESIAKYRETAYFYNNQKLFKIEIIDIKDRIKIRFGYAIFLGTLLFVQNVAVFGLIVWALWMGALKDLQGVFSIVVPATLLETVYLVKVVVEWLFKDIDYTKHANQSK